MTEFERVVRDHGARYPIMLPQDYGKLAYQSEFGPAHLITDERAVDRAYSFRMAGCIRVRSSAQS